MALIVVNSLGDDVPSGSEITLRKAIAMANSNPSDFDEIRFTGDAASGTIQIGSELVISSPILINGPGADDLTIEAQNSRIFDVFGGFLTVEDLTLTGGQAPSWEGGGAIRILGGTLLTIRDSTITGNTAYVGGGIYSYDLPVDITGSTISGNIADYGGGIHARSGSVSVTSSTISGNLSGGGGIRAGSGSVSVTSSTISGNSASFGGGIHAASGSVSVTSSTISGNSADFRGGGIYTLFGSVSVTSSTISGNSAKFGGGLLVRDSFSNAHLTIASSIIAANTAAGTGNDFVPDPDDTPTVTYSLIGDNTGTPMAEAPIGSPDADGNLIGDPTGAGIIDPMLAPLSPLGGPTLVHPLLVGSPAINMGANPENLDFDQRGFPWEFSGNAADMGAFELQQRIPVTTSVDENGENPSKTSLREAIDYANANPGQIVDVIYFDFNDPSLIGQTVKLIHSQMAIEDEDGLLIQGLGAENTIIDAQKNSRIFDASGGKFDVTLSGLTLTGGQTPTNEDGGAIRFGFPGSDNTGTLTVQDSIISGNSASGFGGGIGTRSGSVTVTSSTISGNLADRRGSGIYTRDGSMSVTNSTISGNSAGNNGGGVFGGFGSVSVTYSSICGNSAGHDGGIGASDGSVSVTYSTISGNSADYTSAAAFAPFTVR